MKLLRYGIVIGVVTFVLFLSSVVFFIREGSSFLRRIYTDEAISSASIDALSLNENIYGAADPKKAMDTFYKSLECFGKLQYGVILVMFLADDGIYYCQKGEEPRKKEYSENGLIEDTKELLTGFYYADLAEKPYILYGDPLEKRSFIAVFDEPGKLCASIGGAVRKRKRENEWNNH